MNESKKYQVISGSRLTYQREPQDDIHPGDKRLMKTREEILRILQEQKPELSRRFGVARLALFGSFARGDYTRESDVDILVEVDPSIGHRFVDLAEEIEAALGVPADVVSRRAIQPRYRKIIQEDLIDVP
jgi:uncharacterized protein